MARRWRRGSVKYVLRLCREITVLMRAPTGTSRIARSIAGELWRQCGIVLLYQVRLVQNTQFRKLIFGLLSLSTAWARSIPHFARPGRNCSTY